MRAIAEGGIRPRFSIHARMRGEGARLSIPEVDYTMVLVQASTRSYA